MVAVPHKSICVIGSIVYDFVMSLPRLPEEGETVLGDKFSNFIGGKGLNQAVQIQRLDAPFTFWGRVGDDRLGREVIQVLEEQDFPVEGIRISPGDRTAVGMIFVGPDGRNMIGGVPTANMNFRLDEIDKAMRKSIREAALVSVQLELPLEVNEAILRLAKEGGVPTLLNAAPYRPLPESLASLVDFWVANEVEAGQFFSCEIEDAEDCAPIAESRVVRDGRQTWVVTLGDRGAAVVDQSGVQPVPGIEVDAVDSTGAGDSFTGGFAVGLAEGMTALEAARFANRVAALSVTKLGGMTGLPRRSELTAEVKR